MKRILILIIGLIGVAYGQYSPTSAKSRFVNGLALGTKLDAYFNAADSNAIYWRADSVVMAKYKGTARALAFASALGDYVPYTGATQNVTIGNFRVSARTLLGDSIMARGSGGTGLYANGGTLVAAYGGGGGAQWVNYGFAGYNANRSSSYTARSFTDKNYVDSSFLVSMPYVTPEQYGAVGDGVTDDKTALQLAINSGKGVFLGSKTYLISDSILLPSNAKVFGLGAKSIIKTNRNRPALVIGGDNIQLTTFWLQGSGPDSTLNNGIQVRGTLDEKTDNIIDGLFISGFGSAGIYAVDNPSSVFAANLIVNNTVSSNNEFGFWNAVRAEYTIYSNCVANGNRVGWRNAGGNNSWNGGQLNNNEVGLYLEEGDNNAHSVITGATLNHNTSYSVQGSFVTDGYLINDCMLYFGNVLLESSEGIKFSNSEFSTDNFIVGGGSVELISNKFKTTTNFIFDYLGDTAVYRFMDNTFEGTPPPQDTSRFQQIISSSSLTPGGMLKSTTRGAIVNAVAGTDYQTPITNPITGTGTANSIPKFTSSSTIGNSSITDNGTTVSTTVNASVGGYLTVGGTSTDGYLTLSRGANTTYEAATIYRTSGAGNWIVGTRANSTNDFLFFNGTTGTNSITISAADGAVTAWSSLSATKIIGNSYAPSISGGSATYIGTGASTSVSGNDMAGVATLITGTGCGSTGASNRAAFTVTFASAYASAPIVIIQAIQRGGLNTTDGPSESFFLRRDAVGTTAFTVYLPIGVTLTDSTTYDITYHVIGK